MNVLIYIVKGIELIGRGVLMYYNYEVAEEIMKILDGNGEYDIFVAKSLNNELKEIIIVPHKKG